MPRLEPNTILITGATGGIGGALAYEYAGPNKTLILTGRDLKRLEEVVKKCQEKGAKVYAKAFDITDNNILSEWLFTMLRENSIDLVIANAGTSAGISENGQWESLDAINNLLQVNLSSVINTIYPVIEKMRQQKKGHVAIMSSLAAFRGLPQSPSYCASKAAVKIYGDSLRSLLTKENINISVICPGFVKTSMSDKLAGPKPFLMSPAKAAKIIKKQLDKRKNQIAFPTQLMLAIRLLNLLPQKLVDGFLVRVKAYVNENHFAK